MKVEVRLFATLREGRFKKSLMDFDENTSPKDIIDNLNIGMEHVAILLVNGKDGKLDYILQDGDVVSIFPPVGGG